YPQRLSRRARGVGAVQRDRHEGPQRRPDRKTQAARSARQAQGNRLRQDRGPRVRYGGSRRRMSKRQFKIWRGDATGGDFKSYDVEVDPGMVVLDVLHRIQASDANDLALRWNCKAGKCGSCSMEINGKPRLSCMTRMNSFAADEMITCQPLKT